MKSERTIKEEILNPPIMWKLKPQSTGYVSGVSLHKLLTPLPFTLSSSTATFYTLGRKEVWKRSTGMR